MADDSDDIPPAMIKASDIDWGRPIDLPGMVSSGPLTIVGVWDDGRIRCVVCDEPFTPGPEGTPILVESDTDVDIGPVCTGCGVALTAPTEEA